VLAKLREAKQHCRKRRGWIVVSESLNDPLAVQCETYDEAEKEEAPDQEPGDQVNARRLANVVMGKELDYGGHADVHRGSWQGRDVALKKAKPGKEQYLIAEINLLWSLRHQNLVEIYGYWMDARSQLWLVMEYVPRGHLGQALRKVSPIQVMLDIAVGMAFLHSKNIIHRDLKPNNILITDNRRAKIADFGVAKLFDEDEEEHTRVGTTGYRPPEVSSGQYGLSADVYCYGMLFKRIYAKEKYPDSNFDRDLKELAEECVKKQPEKRPTFAGIVARLTKLQREG